MSLFIQPLALRSGGGALRRNPRAPALQDCHNAPFSKLRTHQYWEGTCTLNGLPSPIWKLHLQRPSVPSALLFSASTHLPFLLSRRPSHSSLLGLSAASLPYFASCVMFASVSLLISFIPYQWCNRFESSLAILIRTSTPPLSVA